MKFNGFFSGLTAMSLAISPLAAAEVKPVGTVLETYCGENVAPSQERNREITKVCLGVVSGMDIEVLIVRSENARGTKLDDQVLPIMSKKALRPSNSAVLKQSLVMASSEVESGRYDILKTTTAVLSSNIGRTRVPTPTTPMSLKGKDLNGVPFEVQEFHGILHTQSLE